MALSFLPKAIFDKLTDVSADFLRSRGVTLLMLDFDNTMLPYTSRIPSDSLLDWLEKMKASDITLCVVSNSKKDKAMNFCKAHGIGCIKRSKKPFQRGIRQCLKTYARSPSQAALVGDQIYTDVLGANCGGCFSILVTPIHLSNFWLKLRHVAEMPFIFLAGKRRITNEKS